MSWLDLPGAPATLEVPRVDSCVDTWIDLFVTGWLRQAPAGAGLPVLMADTLRSMPLLESQGPAAWVHTGALRYVDHVLVANGQPARRHRVPIDRQPLEAARLLRQAGICLISVPGARAPAQTLAGWALHAVSARVPLLIYGSPGLAGWQAFDGLVRQAGLQPVEAGRGRVLASAGLAGAVGAAGLCDAEAAQSLAAQLVRSRQADVHVEPLAADRIRLRLRIDPVLLSAAGSPTLAHHIVHEGRALFNGRGLGGLLLPWAAPLRARLLLRNVRARIEGGELALGDQRLQPLAVDYTDHGAFMRLDLPGVEPGRDALLQISLPRDAVPGDGFCDIGAAEFTLETT